VIKVTFVIIFLIGILVLWIRAKWAISKNRGQSKKLVNGLRNNQIGIRDLAASLDVIILRKPITTTIDTTVFLQKMTKLNDQTSVTGVNIEYATADQEHHAAVIAEARVKGHLQSGEFSQTTILHYPCWFYIQPDQSTSEWKFYSVMPTDSEHQHVLEDFAKWLYEYINLM
jgi:hypothetical protein